MESRENSNSFCGRVDLGLLTQTLEGHELGVDRMRDLGSWSLQQWGVRYFWSW
jgi:hypothetical protein